MDGRRSGDQEGRTLQGHLDGPRRRDEDQGVLLHLSHARADLFLRLFQSGPVHHLHGRNLQAVQPGPDHQQFHPRLNRDAVCVEHDGPLRLEHGVGPDRAQEHFLAVRRHFSAGLGLAAADRRGVGRQPAPAPRQHLHRSHVLDHQHPRRHLGAHARLPGRCLRPQGHDSDSVTLGGCEYSCSVVWTIFCTCIER